MKKFLPVVMLLVSMVFFTYAQSPQQFNYQGAARNASGTPVANKTISLRISILDGSADGNAQYTEVRSVTTNSMGLYAVAIGSGGTTTSTGSVAAVTWGAGLKFIKVEIDPNNGSNFTPAGTAQLLSVPYALYAANAPAGSLTGAAGGDLTGNYPNPSLASLQGKVLNASSPVSNQVLLYDGSSWKPAMLDATQLSGGKGLTSTDLSISANGTSALLKDVVVDINTGAVTSAKLADNAVLTSKLADASVSIAKLTTAGAADANKVYVTNSITGQPELVNKWSFSNGSGWSLRGNTGNMDQSTNFLGNTDDVAINFMVNGQKSGRLGNSLENNIAFGYKTLISNISGFYNSTFGKEALSLNVSGYENSAFGYMAMQRNFSGIYNSSFGSQSLLVNTVGSNNTAVGAHTLMSSTTGSANTAIGSLAMETSSGDRNTAVGYAAGSKIAGAGNVFLGHRSGANLTAANNTLIIANSETVYPLLQGTFTNDGGTLTVNHSNAANSVTIAPAAASTLNVNGSLSASILTYTSGGTLNVDGSHYTVRIKNANTPLNINLPSAVNVKGRIYIIVKALSSGNISFNTPILLNDDSTITTITGAKTLMIQSDGTSWIAIN